MFDGPAQYDRFNSIMRDIVRSEEHCDTFVSLGLKPEYFGTHSIRKGAITHAACGVTVSPPIASICIRANWKMPGVMNRYIRFESAGDMYVGKSVCGRDRMGEEFAESCPYFDFTHCELGEKERRHQIIDAWIRSRMPGGGENHDVFVLFKRCVASFVYHRQWLDRNLHPESEVRGCIFWSEIVPFAANVTTKHLWDKTADTPSFTGLPPDVLYMSQLRTLMAKFDELKECLLADNQTTKTEIIAGIETSLDNRAVGGEGYGRLREIHEMLESLVQRADAPVAPPPAQDPDVTVDELVEFNCQADDEDEYADLDITFDEGTGGIHQHNEAAQSAHLASKRQMKKRKMAVGFHQGC